MHQLHLQLSDQLFAQMKRRAEESGFKSVEEYASDLLYNDLSEDVESFDHLFTPERIAHLDKVADEVRAGGKTYTLEEVGARLEAKKAEFMKKLDS